MFYKIETIKKILYKNYLIRIHYLILLLFLNSSRVITHIDIRKLQARSKDLIFLFF